LENGKIASPKKIWVKTLIKHYSVNQAVLLNTDDIINYMQIILNSFYNTLKKLEDIQAAKFYFTKNAL